MEFFLSRLYWRHIYNNMPTCKCNGMFELSFYSLLIAIMIRNSVTTYVSSDITIVREDATRSSKQVT